MVWKPIDWKRTVRELQNRCRSFMGELFSAVANEESRIARMELDGRLESIPTGKGCKDEA